MKVLGLVEAVAKHFKLAKREQEAKTPGGNKILAGKVGTTVTNLRKLGLLKSPRPECVAIPQTVGNGRALAETSRLGTAFVIH